MSAGESLAGVISFMLSSKFLRGRSWGGPPRNRISVWDQVHERSLEGKERRGRVIRTLTPHN